MVLGFIKSSDSDIFSISRLKLLWDAMGFVKRFDGTACTTQKKSHYAEYLAHLLNRAIYINLHQEISWDFRIGVFM